MDEIRVFVYGTLREGEPNHRIVRGRLLAPVERAVTEPGWALYDLGPYPAMAATSNGVGCVYGDLVVVDEATLAVLDRFEGVDVGHYQRVAISVHNADGDDCSAWAFVQDLRQVRGAPRLTPGDWTTHRLHV